nr:immunoglobulin light chain junction region [Macaca mulatta]MOW70245.1 immunoglobulin light chain junction region [Macaca mulatta]MOW71845.1 immunoglobulin light chain junction region [Macaca mulatta]
DYYCQVWDTSNKYARIF